MTCMASEQQQRLREMAYRKRIGLADYIFVFGDGNGHHLGEAAVTIDKITYSLPIDALESELDQADDSDSFRQRIIDTGKPSEGHEA